MHRFMTYVRPFLKWPGGKYRLLHHILKHLPQGNRLVEPFGGSGAVFINTQFCHYLITESNRDLILLFKQLQQEGTSFIQYCACFFTTRNNQADYYYQYRHQFNHSRNPRKRAALFLYLNRHGYNGLCRYNQQGIYNVPFGQMKRPYFPEQEMQHFYMKSQSTQFIHQDFRQTFAQLQAGDVLYCDPPYCTLSKTSSFTTYTGLAFTQVDQCDLLALIKTAVQQNITVIMSNHDTAFTRQYYHATHMEYLPVQRYISCKANPTRSYATELLAVFKP